MALTTVLAVVVPGHEDAWTTLRRWALAAELLHRAVIVDAVVLERSHLDLAVFVLNLLGSRVRLLLALLGTTTQTKYEVQGRLLLNVVVTQSAAILELLTSEDQTLLVRRNALLVLNLGLHIVNRVRGLNLERDRLASQGLDEDLHGRQRRSYDAKETSSSAISRLPPYESLQFCECHVQVYAHGTSSTWHSRAEIFLRRWLASSAHRAAGLVSSDTLQTSKCSIHQATLFGHESTIRRKRQ